MITVDYEVGQRRSARTVSFGGLLLGRQEEHLDELSDAARRAGSIVTDYIESMVATAERQAMEIRQNADREAELARQEALASAQRVFDRINALEQPLGELVQTLQMEMERVRGELEAPVDAEPIGIPARAAETPDQGGATPTPSPPAPEVVPPETWFISRKPDSERTQLREVPAVEDSAPVAAERAPAAPEETTAEPIQAGPVDAEAIDAEPMDAEALDAEAVEAAAVDAEALDAEAVDAEALEAEALDAEALEDETGWAAAEPVVDSAPLSAARREAEPAVAGQNLPAIRTPGPVPTKELAIRAKAPAPAAEKPRRKFLSLFTGRGSKGVFVTTQGHCAVCQRTFTAGSEENLRLSGWRVSGEVGLCPDCQADEWQLPEGARLPFRRGGA